MKSVIFALVCCLTACNIESEPEPIDTASAETPVGNESVVTQGHWFNPCSQKKLTYTVCTEKPWREDDWSNQEAHGVQEQPVEIKTITPAQHNQSK